MSKTADAEKSAAKAAPKSGAKVSTKANAGGAAKAPAEKPAGKAEAKKAAAPKAESKAAAAPAKAGGAKPAAAKPAAGSAKASAAAKPAGKTSDRILTPRPSERILPPKVTAERVEDSGEPRTFEPRPPDKTSANGRSMVVGPIESKRFGRSLVIDISAPQVALTARRGVSLPRASLIVTTAAREIIVLAREAVKIDSIAVVGSDQDPSTHPDLREIAENLRALRDKHLPRAKLRVFTAARDLTAYDLRATLALFERIHLQFEWGTAKVFSAVTGEKPTTLTTLVKHASSFDHLIVEANFFKGPDDKDNANDAEVKLWIKKLQEIRPSEVHILPGVGSATGCSKVKAVNKARRDEIAEEVAEKAGLSVSVHEDDALLV